MKEKGDKKGECHLFPGVNRKGTLTFYVGKRTLYIHARRPFHNKTFFKLLKNDIEKGVDS